MIVVESGGHRKFESGNCRKREKKKILKEKCCRFSKICVKEFQSLELKKILLKN